MDSERQTRLLEVLLQRRDALAADWRRQLAQTSYVALGREELLRRLEALLEQCIRLLFTEPFDETLARGIGGALSNLHFVNPDALGVTIGILGRELCADLAPQDVLALVTPLLQLVEGVATGFAAGTCRVVLKEQESVRGALVSELEDRRLSLERARRDLEDRVDGRTAELQQANFDLRAEMDQRLRVTEALRLSEERYRDLVENVSEVIFSVDVKGIVTYVSPSVEPMLALNPEKIIGRNYSELMFGSQATQADVEFETLVGGESNEGEYSFVLPDGQIRWVRVSSQPVFDPSGQHVIGLHGIVTNITKRKEAEGAQRESEERLRLLLAESPDVILTVDRMGTIDYLNRVPLIAGESISDVVGRPAIDFAAPGHKEMIQSAIRATFETGESSYSEAQSLTPEGQYLWYGAQMVPILRHGEVDSVMMISRDITERKEIDDIKDQLIRDVSHELRTPLAKMQMSMELLLELAGEQEASRQLMRLGQRTLHNIQRLLRTVEAILDLSVLEAGIQRYHLEEIALEDLLRDVVTDMEPLAWSRELELVLQVEQKLQPVKGDDEKLYRVLVNLIDNAVKFSEEGQITVAATACPGEIEVTVTDSGQGIVRENLDKVFERFFQEKPRFHGVGVGLSICKTIIQAHGGRVWAESPGRGQGSTFKFRLPIMNPEEEQSGDSADTDC